MTIHKEGRSFLLLLLVVLGLINILVNYYNSRIFWFVFISSSILFLLILQFFRSPRIVTSINDKNIIAPADGKVAVIEKVREEEYLNHEVIQISIFMSPLNVHVNRTPVSGVIERFEHHPGKYLVAWHPKSSSENEQTSMVIITDTGLKILVKQIAGAVARRIKWYVKAGDQLVQGNEYGFIKFGSRLDVLLPIDASIKVAIGDKTIGGKTILAEIN